MTRADFWCRVLGWLQIASGALLGVLVMLVWRLFADWLEPGAGALLEFFKWLLIVLFALPPFLSGTLTVLFANRVEQSRLGLRGQEAWPLRILMILAGLWSAGVIGFTGLQIPPVTPLALFGIATAIMGAGGPDWTADLFAPRDRKP